MNKKGVSLIILVVTVIILSILVSVTITAGLKSVNTSKLNIFESNLSQIEDYVLANSDISKYTKGNILRSADLISKLDNVTQDEQLKEDFGQNGDLNSNFKEIDIDKISENEISNGKGIQ